MHASRLPLYLFPNINFINLKKNINSEENLMVGKMEISQSNWNVSLFFFSKNQFLKRLIFFISQFIHRVIFVGFTFQLFFVADFDVSIKITYMKLE